MIGIAESDYSIDVGSDIDTVELIEDVEADEKQNAADLKTEKEEKERAQKIIEEREVVLAAQKEKREQEKLELEQENMTTPAGVSF